MDIRQITTELYDVMLLNEVLYYLALPLDILNRVSALLMEDGIFVISMVESSGHYI